MEEIIVLDTHNDNPPDNDNWHTDVTFIDTPPAGAILAAKELPMTGGDTLWTSGIAAPGSAVRTFPAAAERPACRTRFPQIVPRSISTTRPKPSIGAGRKAVAKHPPLLHPVVRTHPVTGKQALFVNEGFTTRIVEVSEKRAQRC